mgnify:CR=1 FL=1
MSNSYEYPAGTWVRFQQNGQLVVAVVQYHRRTNLGYKEYITDTHGSVREDKVLEARGPDHTRIPPAETGQ